MKSRKLTLSQGIESVVRERFPCPEVLVATAMETLGARQRRNPLHIIQKVGDLIYEKNITRQKPGTCDMEREEMVGRARRFADKKGFLWLESPPPETPTEVTVMFRSDAIFHEFPLYFRTRGPEVRDMVRAYIIMRRDRLDYIHAHFCNIFEEMAATGVPSISGKVASAEFANMRKESIVLYFPTEHFRMVSFVLEGYMESRGIGTRDERLPMSVGNGAAGLSYAFEPMDADYALVYETMLMGKQLSFNGYVAYLMAAQLMVNLAQRQKGPIVDGLGAMGENIMKRLDEMVLDEESLFCNCMLLMRMDP